MFKQIPSKDIEVHMKKLNYDENSVLYNYFSEKVERFRELESKVRIAMMEETDSVEFKLDEADRLAELDMIRLSHEEVFGKVRAKLLH